MKLIHYLSENSENPGFTKLDLNKMKQQKLTMDL